MGRSPCCSKEGLNRGAWTAMEDKTLTEYIQIHGEGQWRNLPKRAGLKRCGKSCRLRWLNYLRPGIKRGNITPDEEELIIRLHKLLGNRWSLIAGRLPGRTDNEIKNYWNTNIGKKLQFSKSGQQQQITHSCLINSKRKPSSQQQQQNKAKHPSKPNSIPNSCVNVIRTKATRCTKVFIDIRNRPQLQDDTATRPSLLLTPRPEPSSSLEHVRKDIMDDNNYDPSSFMVDLEMDENFLSECLNSELISQLPQSSSDDHFQNRADNYSNNSTADTCDQLAGQCNSSTNSDDADHRQYSLLFSDDQNHDHDHDLMQDVDFTSIASLMESEFMVDWLQDQADVPN